MPRAKYTKPPGPFQAIEQIRSAKFRFRAYQWRKLTKLLPSKLADLSAPPDAATKLPKKAKTIADRIVQRTEDRINLYLMISNSLSDASITPANVRSAIRRLRIALKPFISGSVDDETAAIIPSDIDAKLAIREQEIARLRLPPARLRALAMLCQYIEILVRQFTSANGETVSEQEILCYVDASLNFAGIKHPNITKYRRRLAALVFPKDMPPQSQG